MISDNCVFALPMSFHAVQRDVVCCSHSHAHDKAIFSFVKASFNQHVSEGEALQILTLLIILFCSRCAAIHECMSLFSPIMHVDTNRWKSAEDPSSTSQPLSACFARWALLIQRACFSASPCGHCVPYHSWSSTSGFDGSVDSVAAVACWFFCQQGRTRVTSLVLRSTNFL